MTDTAEPLMEDSLAAAVVAALGELSEIVADETADTGQYTYRYASLAGIMRAVRPVLARHHLVVTQRLASDLDYLCVQTSLVWVTGEEYSSGWLHVKAPQGAQQIGSWVSYLRRYQLTALLGLAVEDDDGKGSAPTEPPSRSTTVTRPSGGLLTAAQRTLILTLFGELGMAGPEFREERLSLTAEVIGRDIETTNEVTGREASGLIEHLRARVARLEEERPHG
jgi:hypothetical protein